MTDEHPMITKGKAIIKTFTQTIEITPDLLEWKTETDDDYPLVTHIGVYRFDGGEISWTIYDHMDSAIDTEGCHLLQNFTEFSFNIDLTDGTYEDNSDPDNYFRNYL